MLDILIVSPLSTKPDAYLETICNILSPYNISVHTTFPEDISGYSLIVLIDFRQDIPVCNTIPIVYISRTPSHTFPISTIARCAKVILQGRSQEALLTKHFYGSPGTFLTLPPPLVTLPNPSSEVLQSRQGQISPTGHPIILCRVHTERDVDHFAHYLMKSSIKNVVYLVDTHEAIATRLQRSLTLSPLPHSVEVKLDTGVDMEAYRLYLGVVRAVIHISEVVSVDRLLLAGSLGVPIIASGCSLVGDYTVNGRWIPPVHQEYSSTYDECIGVPDIKGVVEAVPEILARDGVETTKWNTVGMSFSMCVGSTDNFQKAFLNILTEALSSQVDRVIPVKTVRIVRIVRIVRVCQLGGEYTHNREYCARRGYEYRTDLAIEDGDMDTYTVVLQKGELLHPPSLDLREMLDYLIGQDTPFHAYAKRDESDITKYYAFRGQVQDAERVRWADTDQGYARLFGGAEHLAKLEPRRPLEETHRLMYGRTFTLATGQEFCPSKYGTGAVDGEPCLWRLSHGTMDIYTDTDRITCDRPVHPLQIEQVPLPSYRFRGEPLYLIWRGDSSKNPTSYESFKKYADLHGYRLVTDTSQIPLGAECVEVGSQDVVTNYLVRLEDGEACVNLLNWQPEDGIACTDTECDSFHRWLLTL